MRIMRCQHSNESAIQLFHKVFCFDVTNIYVGKIRGFGFIFVEFRFYFVSKSAGWSSIYKQRDVLYKHKFSLEHIRWWVQNMKVQ